MRRTPLLLALCIALAPMTTAGGQSGSIASDYREAAGRIIGEALLDTSAWDRLAVLTDDFGHRLTGSPQLERAIEWALEEMKKDGLENVRAEKVIAPHWVRGDESLELTHPLREKLVMLGLGGSVGTPPEGTEAEVLVVQSFDELEAQSARASGRIVVYNVPFTSYGETVRYRSSGAARAARHGARAMLLRSVGPTGLRTPHTGAIRYEDGVPRIPAAAIPAEDAARLQRMQDRGVRVTVRLKMEAHFLPDVESANVVAEILGSERPEEVVVIGGHIDSWDTGTGAMDDGGGCVVTWEALRILKKLGLRPRRTLRVVLWTNEESGLAGAFAYRDRYRDQLRNHVLMLESDSGVFRPRGFGFSGSDRARATVREIASLLRGIGADRIGPSGGGADIGPSVREGGIPAMSLDVDGEKYFLVHHTPADTIDRIDPTEMALCVAAVAVMAYVVADLPERLDR